MSLDGSGIFLVIAGPEAQTTSPASAASQHITKPAPTEVPLEQPSSERHASADFSQAECGTEADTKLTDLQPTALIGKPEPAKSGRKSAEGKLEGNHEQPNDAFSTLPASPSQQGSVYSTSGALKAALLRQLSGDDELNSPSFEHAALQVGCFYPELPCNRKRH